MNEHETEHDYPACVVEIRSSSSVRGLSPGVMVRATSKATPADVVNATDRAWAAWYNIRWRLANDLTEVFKPPIEKEQADG